MADLAQKLPSKRGKGRPFVPGPDPRRGKEGGRPPKLREIEKMLDAEHRTVDNMKEVFAQLKAMATENVISRWVDKDGQEHESIRQPNPAFMALYLDRILGPVKELKIDLTDAPDEVVAYLAEKLN
jgi:hypothetical protein